MDAKITEIETKLKAKLDPAHVKSREQGSSKVQYIEGWHAIQTTNEIFGHLDWSRETPVLREVCRYENKNGNHVVGYEAKVVVTIETAGKKVIREGTGYGSGIAKDLFSAIESAGKEAETDAMKRAMMTLGNPLGLALYDKTRENVGVEEPKIIPAFESDIARQNFKEDMIDLYGSANTVQDLKDCAVRNKAKTDAMKVGTDEDIEAFNVILKAYVYCHKKLTKAPAIVGAENYGM